jgi:hypothetical protein
MASVTSFSCVPSGTGGPRVLAAMPRIHSESRALGLGKDYRHLTRAYDGFGGG